MTMSTSIYLLDPVPVREMFEFCQDLLGDRESQLWEERSNPALGEKSYENKIGQGFVAILWVTYGPDGPLHYEGDEDFEYCARVYFDTGYGFRANGANVEDLHAALLTEVTRWADEHGSAWKFSNWENLLNLGTTSEDILQVGDPIVGAKALRLGKN